MWLKNLFKPNNDDAGGFPALFDEALLRRLEKLNFRTSPMLRGGMMGERRSRKLRPALDFSDHRPYTAGDDLRYIDWHAFGRSDHLFVRLGESPQTVDVHLLLDCSPSMSWTWPDHDGPSKWDKARQLTGALSYLGLSGGERLHLSSFDQTLGQTFGPTRGKQRIVPTLQFISRLESALPQPEGYVTAAGIYNHQPRGFDWGTCLTDYARQHRNGGLLILISDLFDTAPFDTHTTSAADTLAEGLRHLTPPHWQLLVLHLLTEQELNPTFEGDWDLQDMETGQVLPFHFDEATLIQYRMRLRRWCTDLKHACAKRNATYAQIVVEWPLEKAVIPYLRQRGVV